MARRVVLGGTDDQLVSPAEVQATARAYNTEAELFPHMAHDMMLEAGWEAVADRILKWLTVRILEANHETQRYTSESVLGIDYFSGR